MLLCLKMSATEKVMYNSGPNVSTLLSGVFIRGDLKLLGNSLEFLHSLMSIYSYYCDKNMCR